MPLSKGLATVARSARILSFLACLLILGCATSEGFKERMGQWVGADQQEVVRVGGTPAREFTAPSGNRVYEYRKGLPSQHPLYVTPSAATGNLVVGGGPDNFFCLVWFEIRDQKVVDTNWRGDACRA